MSGAFLNQLRFCFLAIISLAQISSLKSSTGLQVSYIDKAETWRTDRCPWVLNNQNQGLTEWMLAVHQSCGFVFYEHKKHIMGKQLGQQMLTTKIYPDFSWKGFLCSDFHIMSQIPYFCRILVQSKSVYPLSFGKLELLLWLFGTSSWWRKYKWVSGQKCVLGIMKPHASGSKVGF